MYAIIVNSYDLISWYLTSRRIRTKLYPEEIANDRYDNHSNMELATRFPYCHHTTCKNTYRFKLLCFIDTIITEYLRVSIDTDSKYRRT